VADALLIERHLKLKSATPQQVAAPKQVPTRFNQARPGTVIQIMGLDRIKSIKAL
jgi:hypothetical protein